MSQSSWPHEHQLLMLEFEDTPFHDELFVGHYHSARARHGLGVHQHPGRMEICYLAKGQQVYEVAGQRYPLHGNDLYLTFPDEWHSTGEFPQEKGSLYWMQVRCPPPGEPLLTLRPEYAAALTGALLAVPRRSFRGDRRMPAMFEDILTTYFNDDGPLRAVRIAARVIDFLYEVVRCAGVLPGADGLPTDIARCLAHIDAGLDGALAVEELARVADLSISRFKTKFKQVTGVPPAEYVLRRKIERAKTLLHANVDSITSIAFTLGFSSSQHFATVFRRYTNMQPLRYRRVTEGND